MPLLLDLLRRGDWHAPFSFDRESRRQRERFAPLFEVAVPIEASNVAEWLYAGTDQEFWNYREDFPNVAPPWEVFWVECRRPRHDVSSENADLDGTDPAAALPERWGVLFAAEQLDDGWVLNGFGFMEQDREIVGPLFDLRAEVDDEGRWVHHEGALDSTERQTMTPTAISSPDERSWGFMVPVMKNADLMTTKTYMEAVNSLILAPLMAVTFAHCRNVKQATHHPAKKIAARQERKYGVRPKAHRTLEIGPAASVVDAEAARSGQGLQQALHVVRGHFKTYTEDAPLMGKHTGTYWWAQQLRGDSASGEVTKDYEVQA